MCGRFTMASPNPALLRERFALGDEVPVVARFNVAPADEVLAVTTSREGERRGDLLRWGLVPHWAKDPSTAHKMINARAETVAEKPAYRDAFARRRCLVLADGFYEWQPAGPGRARKQPFWITRADGAPFAFAGLWATWHPPGDGEAPALRTCTIVTTQAAPSIHAIHPRMPVILPGPEAEAAWLAADTPAPLLHELLAPLPDAEIAAREVGFAVNDARHDAPDCLEPPGEPAEQTLF